MIRHTLLFFLMFCIATVSGQHCESLSENVCTVNYMCYKSRTDSAPIRELDRAQNYDFYLSPKFDFSIYDIVKDLTDRGLLKTPTAQRLLIVFEPNKTVTLAPRKVIYTGDEEVGFHHFVGSYRDFIGSEISRRSNLAYFTAFIPSMIITTYFPLVSTGITTILQHLETPSQKISYKSLWTRPVGTLWYTGSGKIPKISYPQETTMRYTTPDTNINIAFYWDGRWRMATSLSDTVDIPVSGTAVTPHNVISAKVSYPYHGALGCFSSQSCTLLASVTWSVGATRPAGRSDLDKALDDMITQSKDEFEVIITAIRDATWLGNILEKTKAYLPYVGIDGLPANPAITMKESNFSKSEDLQFIVGMLNPDGTDASGKLVLRMPKGTSDVDFSE